MCIRDSNWTLATRLGDMLRRAEEQFGQRDNAYTILGVEFFGNNPMIWFPGNCKHVVVQLSVDCLNDLPRACYQLGHECIHLLAPTGKQDANMLEEGLATLYGENYATEWFNTPRDCGGRNYERAKRLTQKALSTNPTFIREIRQCKPCFCDITPDDIISKTSVTHAEAELLCQPFSQNAV